MANYQLHVAYGLDQGLKRNQNEDAVAFHYPDSWGDLSQLGALFVLADGVGGLPAGVLASDAAVRGLIQAYYTEISATNPTQRLQQALQQVNQQVFQSYHTGATTIVAALVHGDEMLVAHAGDSRAYLYQAPAVRQLTQDHVMPVQQADGRIKNKLVQALGHKSHLDVELQHFRLNIGQRVILMSDGVTRYLDDAKLATLCQQHNTPQALVHAIIDFSNRSGGADNISVVVVEVGNPLSGEQDLKNHLRSLVHSRDQNIATEPTVQPSVTEKRRSILPTLLNIIVIAALLGVGAYFWWQNSAATIPVNLPTVESTAAPVIAVSATPSQPVTTTLETSTQGLSEEMQLVFEAGAATYVRIQEDVVAFVLETNQPYLIAESYQMRNGEIWYRLVDERNETDGWIREADLPAYRAVP
jgi:serine/threonine protein phosphatase PrpC